MPLLGALQNERLRSAAAATATTAPGRAGQRQLVALHFAVISNLNIIAAKVLRYLETDFHAIGFSVRDLNRSAVAGFVGPGQFAAIVFQLYRNRGRAAS